MRETLAVKHASSCCCPECGGPFVLAGSEDRIRCGPHSYGVMVLGWFAECGLRDARIVHTNVKGVTAIGRR